VIRYFRRAWNDLPTTGGIEMAFVGKSVILKDQARVHFDAALRGQ